MTDLKSTAAELDKRTRQQAMVADLGLRAMHFGNVQALMDEAVRLVAQALGARSCEVFELRPGGEELLLRAGAGRSRKPARMSADISSLAGYALTAQSPVVVDDLSKETRFTRLALAAENDAVSGIGVVIQDRRQPYGVLSAHSNKVRHFTHQDGAFLQSIANILSGAIQRRQDRHAIQRQEKRFLALMDVTTAIVWIADGVGAFVKPQPSWESHTGQPWERHAGFGWLDMLHPDDRESIFQSWSRNLKLGREYRASGRLWSAAAQDFRYFEVWAVPLRDAVGGPVQEWVGIVQDVDERHRAQAALTESENRFRELTEAMPQIVWTTQSDGFVDYVNRRWTELTGFSLKDTRGKARWVEAIHPDDQEITLARFQDAVERGIIYESESRYRMRDGSYRWFLNRGLPVRGPHNRIVRWLGTCTDIDDQKRTQELLSQADRQKNEFLAMLAHELRNPLAPIRACAQMMGLMHLNDPRLEELSNTLERQTNHLARLVDDLLDVSRITQGRIELRKQRLRLDDVVKDAVATVQPLLDSRGHRLALELPRQPLWLDADPTRLTQIVANLLSNAAKYTPQAGCIQISACPDQDQIVIRVRDNGKGIAPDQLERVFDLFSQNAPTLDRSSGGLGLGLTLVKRLAQMHGGDALAHSEGPGQGSEFLVRLPAAKLPAGPETRPRVDHSPRDPAIGQRRILVVDDNHDAASSLTRLLALLGHHTRATYDGRSALEQVSDFDPEVVLLDIGLPELDGYQVARRLRAMKGGQERLLIAITGYGQEHDWRQAMAAGFDHHLLKPVDVNVLKKLL